MSDRVEVSDLEGLDLSAKLELILEAIIDLAEDIQDLRESQAEIVEKINNISSPGVDYDLYDGQES